MRVIIFIHCDNPDAILFKQTDNRRIFLFISADPAYLLKQDNGKPSLFGRLPGLDDRFPLKDTGIVTRYGFINIYRYVVSIVLFSQTFTDILFAQANLILNG